MLPQKRPRPDAKSSAPKLNDQEQKIYTLIKASENTGMWISDLRKAVGITQSSLDKSLKVLLGKELIKPVVSVKYKSRKIYMAVEFEPTKEMSGGNWYQNGALDVELIRILRQLTASFIGKLKIATVDMVLEEIKKSGALEMELDLQQMQDIVGMMVLDKEVDELRSTGVGEFAHLMKGRKCYRRSGGGKGREGKKEGGALAGIPCGVCPRIDECTPDGVIHRLIVFIMTNGLPFRDGMEQLENWK